MLSWLRMMRWAGVLVLSCACSGVFLAETFLVTDDTDQIPSAAGTLRWAIERSEENPGPDRIEFVIDFAHIVLVDALPDLLDGDLAIASPALVAGSPSPPSAYTISGELGVVRALTIRSSGNRIGELRFVNFTGQEAVLVAGGEARDNLFSGCWFGDPDEGYGNTEAGVRIAPGENGEGLPDGTRIEGCGFSHNGIGVLIDGGPTVVPEDLATTSIRRSWFGTGIDGGPGPGNREAIRAAGCALTLRSNVLSGPGRGVSLLGGANGSYIARNVFGTESPDSISCQGFEGAALNVEGSGDLIVDTNLFLCGESGVKLGIGADRAQVNRNTFGRVDGAESRLSGDAIILAGADGGTVSRNFFQAVDGSGISAPGEAGPRNLLTCNIARSVGGPVIFQAEPQVAPPENLHSGPLHLEGNVAPSAPGWIEVFTGDDSFTAEFLGSMEKVNDTEHFTYLLPAGLTLRKDHDLLRLRVRGDRAQHTATWTPSELRETSEASSPLPVTPPRPLFDLVRGEVSHLAPLLAGGVDLGPVTCLAKGVDESAVIDDPELPPAGESFFYLSRRRHPEEPETVGLYDSPLCLDLLKRSLGARIEGPGGCDE